MTKEIEEINENMLNMLTTKELENEQLLKQVESYKKDTAKCELAAITYEKNNEILKWKKYSVYNYNNFL